MTSGGQWTFTELMAFLLDRDVRIATDGQALHYDALDGVMTDDVLVELRRHKPPLIAWLAEHDPGGEVATRALPPYIQQEWWHRARSSPQPTVYTVGRRLCFSGPLRPAALRAALRWLVDRHEALRTRFVHYPDGSGDQPVQEVVAHVPIRLDVTDLTGLPEPDRRTALDERCADQVGLPFPPHRPPLWRTHLFVLGPDRHVLLWTLHHIICDGWSMGILLRELLAAYRAVCAGGVPDKNPVTVTHADYARWQRRHLSGPHGTRLAAFWRDALAGARMTLALPYDQPRPARLSGRGAVRQVHIGPAAVDRLRRSARELGTTFYVVVLTAFARLLAELTGQDDLVIPISHANRTRADHEAVVGLVADRVPVRIRLGDLAPGPVDGFRELVDRVGQAVFGALDHQGLPLSLLVPALDEAGRPPAPYPTVLFTLLDDPDPRADAGDVSVASEPESASGVARMEFYCFLAVSGDGLRGGFEYSTDLFDAATVEAWASRFVTLLEP